MLDLGSNRLPKRVKCQMMMVYKEKRTKTDCDKISIIEMLLGLRVERDGKRVRRPDPLYLVHLSVHGIGI
jgi:hypothetical protein